MTLQTMEKKTEAPVNAVQPKPDAGLSVSRFVLKQLGDWGVSRIYGVIGDATLYVLDELARQNRIRYVPCRSENAAALMASAEAKLTGRLGVCLATSGPGAASLLNGLADAAADRAPVLAITGQVEASEIGTRTKQYIDQQRLVEGVNAQTELLAHPDALPEVLPRLMAQALLQGAVAHLSVPKDVWRQPVKGVTVPYSPHLHQRPQAPEEQIKAASALLKTAAKPLIYMGRGAAAAAGDVRRLAEALGAAVVTTLPARPLFPNDHPLYAGGLGQAGSEAASVLMAECDLLLMLGATWWLDDYAPKALSAKVVQVDLAREQIGMGHPLTLGVVGDVGAIVPRLAAAAGGPAQPGRAPWAKRIADVCGAWKAALEAEAAPEGVPLAPQRVMRAVSSAAADHAVIAVDTGDHTLWFERVFQAKPKQDILVSGRWRTLGFALPAAIAARLVYPDRQVLAIAGDGGVVQTIMEFQTAVEQNLPVVLIILDNGSYAMEKNKMELAGLQTLGSVIRNPDFVKLAEACGGMGYVADSAVRLESCLNEALQSRTPSLIAVKTADTAVPHTKI